MIETKSFKELFLNICEIKQFVIKLEYNDLKNYKMVFYNQDFPEWRLDLLWEFIWDDRSYEEIEHIFSDIRRII